ncbi:MAG: hypothetical protein IJS39_10965, partial [Synergistaceae bacterium]|nr:hypothetical protein [Synergistaceae bacterium]
YVDDALLPPGFSSIQSWLEKRNYAKHKLHLRKWLHLWQIDTLQGFADVTHALGLNDTLWVKKANSSLSWQNVSLYSNPFTDVVSKTAFSKGLGGLQLSSTSPEFTSEGSFEKCWIRQKDGSILLFKKGSEGFANSGLEPYSEFYASQLSSLICRSSVGYNLRKFKRCLVSVCGLFTNEDEGFVPAYKYLDSSQSYGIKDILAFLKPYGLDDDFRDMIVLDAVILNTDRHLGNFGFIVDNDTFRIKRFAPVFDHNMALLARAMDCSIVEDYSYTLGIGHKIGAGFVASAKNLLTARTREILRSILDFSFSRHKSYNLPQKRLAFLEHAVREQARDILTR